MSGEFRLGSWLVQPSQSSISCDGKTTRLEPKMVDVLVCLVEHSGETVSKEQLIRRVWGETFVTDDVLTRCISELRKALQDDFRDPHVIQTVPRKGYRLLLLAEPVGKIKSRKTRRYVTAGVLLCLALGVAVTYARFRHPASSLRSLAVLPLKNLSGDPAQEYFADGMTEAVIGRLSMIRGLRVISRTSVMRYKDSRMSVPEIAKALQVDALVEGSVIREGGRVRVSAQLIRGATEEHLWSEAYDREPGDVLSLESEVAQSIARRVKVTVTGEERERLVAARHVSPEVYETYLKGEFAKSNSRAEIQESIAYFEEAIREDATFAPAYVGLANAYTTLGSSGIGEAPPSELRPKVISATRKALELDPALPEAHALLADVYQEQWQWSDAEGEFKRALDLNPNDAGAHLAFAGWLLSQGRTQEALAWSLRARELDPEGRAGTEIGWILFNARRYGEATHELRSVLAVRPDDATALWFLGFALIANGQSEEAIHVLEKTVSIMNRSPGAIGVLVRAYAHAGRRADALRLLAELKVRQQAGYVPAAAFVNAYLGLGDYEQAFAWLERAYQEQSSILLWLKVHPFFDPLRGDPRFADLLRRVGLDHAQ